MLWRWRTWWEFCSCNMDAAAAAAGRKLSQAASLLPAKERNPSLKSGNNQSCASEFTGTAAALAVCERCSRGCGAAAAAAWRNGSENCCCVWTAASQAVAAVRRPGMVGSWQTAHGRRLGPTLVDFDGCTMPADRLRWLFGIIIYSEWLYNLTYFKLINSK